MAEPLELTIRLRDLTAAGFAQVNGRLTQLRRVASGLTGIFGAITGTAIGVGVPLFITQTVRAASEAEAQLRGLQEVLQATGRAAELPASAILEFAENLTKTTTASGTATIEIAKLLARFQGIGSELFERTIIASNNLAKVLGTDAVSAANLLGRALNSPAIAVRSLTSAQVALTDTQQRQIKVLADSGRQLEAQRAILSALEQTLGNQIGIKTFEDRVIRLRNAIGDFQERLGGLITRSSAVNAFFEVLAESLDDLLSDPERVKRFQEDFNRFFVTTIEFGTRAGVVISSVAGIVLPFIRDSVRLFSELPPIVQQMGVIAATVVGIKGGVLIGGIVIALDQITKGIQQLRQMANIGSAQSGLIGGLADLLLGPAHPATRLQEINAEIERLSTLLADVQRQGALLNPEQVPVELFEQRVATIQASIAQLKAEREKTLAELKTFNGLVGAGGASSGAKAGAETADGLADSFIARLLERQAEIDAATAALTNQIPAGGFEAEGEGVLSEELIRRIRAAQDGVRLLQGQLRALSAPTALGREVQLIYEQLAVGLERANRLESEQERALARTAVELEHRIALTQALEKAERERFRVAQEAVLDIVPPEFQALERARAGATSEFLSRIQAAGGDAETINKVTEAFVIQIGRIEEANTAFGVFQNSIKAAASSAFQEFGRGISDVFTAFITGSKDAGEALRDFVARFLAGIAQAITQALVLTAIIQALKASGNATAQTIAAVLSGGGLAKGGLTTGPTVALIGDNRSGKELVLPLDDPRALANMRQALGGAGGGNQVSIAVHINSDGSSQVERSPQTANELGRLLESSVVSVLMREQRPGGVLWTGR